MKKISTILCVILAAAMLLCSCGGDVIVQEEAKRRQSTGESWTVMMYMCGSTLEEDYSRAGEVLGSLAYDLPENINVVIETGGSRKWSISDIYSDYLQNYIVQRNGIRLVNQLPAERMGKSSTLSSFLSWSIENYPAEHYMTVVWDHGGGPIGGAAYDSEYNFDSLSLEELKTALSNTGVKMDMIGFDASLMSNLATAAAVSLYADYMTAAEDIMPLKGWDYQDLFEFLSDNPTAAPAQIGKRICDGVMKTADEAESEFVSMAVTDLSKETMLSLAFDGAAKTMVDAASSITDLRSLESSLNQLEYLGGNSQWEGYSNLIDIGQLASALENRIGSPAANLAEAVGEAVIYRCMSEYHSNLSGLGLYYPVNRDSEEIEKYKEICGSASYIDFIEKTCVDTASEVRVAGLENSISWQQYSSLTADNEITVSSDLNGKYILSASHPELIKSAGVNFYMYSKKDSKYIYLFRDYNTTFDSASGGYVYEFKGKIPQLNGTNVSMYLISSGKDFELYSIPVMFDGVLSNIRAVKSKRAKDKGKYTILGLWKGIGKFTGMAERKCRALKSGDVITPLYEVYDDNSSRYIEGSDVRIGIGEAKLADRRISDGDYAVSFTAVDLYGTEHESSTSALTASGGNIKLTAN